MPNKDGTGPEGKGPKTGRQLGPCKGAQPAERSSGQGRGRGMGFQKRAVQEDWFALFLLLNI